MTIALTMSHAGALAGAKHTLVALGVILGLTAFAHCGSGCAQPPTTAGDAYTAEILGCAATASGDGGVYDHDADMICRDGVDKKYCVGTYRHSPECQDAGRGE